MQIFGKNLIDKCMLEHADAANALQRWVDIVENARWHSHNDIKATFPSADYVGKGRYVFNIKGNNYRMVAVVVFVGGFLTVRFIGTHSEYDTKNCLTI
jgi:mRNA interferase HigB